MQAKVCSPEPPALVVLAVILIILMLLGRESFVQKDFPAFLPLNDNFLHVELVGDIDSPGVYQINDGLGLVGAICLTPQAFPNDLLTVPACKGPLQGGERLEIIQKGQRVTLLRRGWMSASHRVSMGIPLHPDRMSFTDWQFLPGIGDALARSIEKDRQENGDFFDLEGLLRVKGIGLKSVKKWRDFFTIM